MKPPGQRGAVPAAWRGTPRSVIWPSASLSA